MTHVPLYWPPDRPEFGTPAIQKRSVAEKPMGFVVDNRATGSNTALEDIISLAIALDYFGGAESSGNDQAPFARLRKSSSAGHRSTHPWRTAVDSAVANGRINVLGDRGLDVLADRSIDGDSSTPSR